MVKPLSLVVVLSVCMFANAPVRAQTTKPEPPEKLSDPAADALQTFLFAQSSNDQAGMKKAIHVTDPAKKDYADAALNFQLWSRYLERKAIDKFGKEEGMRVEGHVRTFDDQYKLDSKRVRDANVQYNNERTTATVYLRVELNRPENLTVGDRFNFLDVYEMIKTSAGWKLDFLKTYKVLDADKEDDYQAEQAAFPRMAHVCGELAAEVKAGKFQSADDLKNAYETKWAHVYDEPIRHVLKPGETLPSNAIPEK